jgi:hypothetical protein
MEGKRSSDTKLSSPFLKWLSTEESIFWLSGKAGSGKSTLMKFLITHPTIDTVLQNAFPDKRILVAWHYLFERAKTPVKNHERTPTPPLTPPHPPESAFSQTHFPAAESHPNLQLPKDLVMGRAEDGAPGGVEGEATRL